MGSNSLKDVILDIDMLNKLLSEAYKLGREDENREERGISPLNLQEEFKKVLDKHL